MAVEFSIRRRIQFAETDLAGILHFSNFFRLMEEVEHAFYRSVGLSVVMHHGGQELGWPRVAASCEYLGPVKFEEELELTLRVARVGEKSLNYEVEFVNAGSGKRVAAGKVTSVCCVMNPEGGMRAVAIPAEIRAKLNGGEG